MVVHYEDNRAELFNLADDPGETTDISENYPGKTVELRKILNARLTDSDAKLPLPNQNFSEKSTFYVLNQIK